MWPTRYSRLRGAFIDVRAMGEPVGVIHDSDSDGMIGDDFHAERSVYTDVVARDTVIARAAAADRSALHYAAYAAARRSALRHAAYAEARVRASSSAASARDASAAALSAARAEAAEARASFRVLCGAVVLFF